VGVQTFAVREDVEARWRSLEPDQELTKANELLADATDLLRTVFHQVGRDIDTELLAGILSARTANRITVAMVIRAMAVENLGATKEQVGFGPFTRAFTAADANLFLRADELRQLGISLIPIPLAQMGDQW